MIVEFKSWQAGWSQALRAIENCAPIGKSGAGAVRCSGCRRKARTGKDFGRRPGSQSSGESVY